MKRCARSPMRIGARKQVRSGLWAFGLISALTLAGCQTAEPESPTAARALGEEQAPVRFPIPEGFAFVPEKSFRHHSNFKAAKFRFENGSAFTDLGELVAFYQSELPKRGWKVTFVYGQSTRKISAEKDGETCDIILARRLRERRTLIVIKTAQTRPS